jgi:hypothetical protein
MADVYVAPTGNDSTGNGTSGNPYATPGKAGGSHSGGDRILIKAGTYTLTSTTSNVAGGLLTPLVGTTGSPTLVVGYNSSIGDLDAVNDFSNFPTLAAAVGAAGRPLQLTANYVHARNLIVDGAQQADRCVQISSSNTYLVNCKVLNFTTFGICVQTGTTAVRRCWATLGKSGATAGFYADTASPLFDTCRSSANPCHGFQCSGGRPVYLFCLSHANTGTSDGFVVLGANSANYRQCVAHSNGRDGIRFDATNSADNSGAWGCVLTSNTNYGLRSAITTWADWDGDYNAFYNNSSGARSGLPAGAHDVTLTGDPFVSASGGNFALDLSGPNAAAAAQLKAAGFPGVFPGGSTTGYMDIGSQHQDNGGGTTTVFVINRVVNNYLVGEE